MQTTDVVVVGAGPTGLMLAGDLAESGLSVRLLERREAQPNLTRAFAVHARTLEHLDMRGLADDLVATGTPIREVRALGGARLQLSLLKTRFPFVLVTPQTQTERVLAERLERVGGRVEHVEVTGLRQDRDGVRVTTSEGEVAASYVVGCDGIGSTVRRAVDLPFPGRSVLRSLMLADVRLGEPPEDVLTANGVGTALALTVPFGDGWWRIVAWDRDHQVDDDVPLDLDEVARTTRKALGTDLGMHDARWLSRFHCDERQAPAYRVGRVFLAGDAAHCHSPAGGLGMNTGLHDVANLSWRLAAAVRGWGRADVLDGYDDERHPVGREVVAVSGAIIRGAMLDPAPLRAVRNRVAAVATSLPPVARRAAGFVSGIDLDYRGERGAGSRAGDRVPDLPLESTRLFEALRGRGHVLVLPPRADRELLGPISPEVDLHTSPAAVDAVLVRPDGHVAWNGDVRDYRDWAKTWFVGRQAS